MRLSLSFPVYILHVIMPIVHNKLVCQYVIYYYYKMMLYKIELSL